MNLGFIGSPEHSGSREMDWIPAGRVSTRRNPWILEGRQYFHRPRNGIQFPDFRFIYTPILRSTISIYIKKKNPVKVADNRLPLSLHSIDFTPFSLPSNSPFLDWKVINTRDGIRWTRDECVRIFLIHRNLILVTIIVEGREELSSNRQARLLDDSCMSWRRKLETAYFTGRRIPSEKSREGTARWRVEYRAAFHGGDSAERSSEKSLTRLKQTFPPPPLSIRGREIRRGLPLTCVSMDEW